MKTQEKENNQVAIYLSSRDWCQSSSLYWVGDITRPDDQILQECQNLLASGDDIDYRYQSDERILTRIKDARIDWLEQDKKGAIK